MTSLLGTLKSLLRFLLVITVLEVCYNIKNWVLPRIGGDCLLLKLSISGSGLGLSVPTLVNSWSSRSQCKVPASGLIDRGRSWQNSPSWFPISFGGCYSDCRLQHQCLMLSLGVQKYVLTIALGFAFISATWYALTTLPGYVLTIAPGYVWTTVLVDPSSYLADNQCSATYIHWCPNACIYLCTRIVQ